MSISTAKPRGFSLWGPLSLRGEDNLSEALTTRLHRWLSANQRVSWPFTEGRRKGSWRSQWKGSERSLGLSDQAILRSGSGHLHSLSDNHEPPTY